MDFSSDPLVSLTVALLIICGGIVDHLWWYWIPGDAGVEKGTVQIPPSTPGQAPFSSLQAGADAHCSPVDSRHPRIPGP
jgi:hypothetical protein